MDHLTMALSLFWYICLFLLFFCNSNGRRTLDAEGRPFHESPDHYILQRSRRQSVNETRSQNETATNSATTRNEMATKLTWTTLMSIVEITGKSVLIVQDNATVATSSPTTSYIMPVEKSSAYIQTENGTQDAIVHSKSTSIASTQLSTIAMSNSSTHNTNASTSTISEAPAKMTDPTFKHIVTSTQTTSTLGKDVKGETAFGRYGLLAFGITIAVVMILVFALIFVLTQRRKKCRPVDIQDEDRSPRLRMLEVPGLGESKDDGLQTYSLGYDNGNNRISVRPPGGIQTPFAGVSTFMLSKRGSNSSTNGSNSSYVSPRNSAMSPLKESPYEFQPLVSDTPSRKGSQRSNQSNQSKKSMKISDKEDVISEI